MQYRTLEQARLIISRLVVQHGVGNYSINFTERNKKKHSVALCNWVSKRFDFVKFYVIHMTDEDFMGTVLHEIAHALTPGHRHDIYFKRVCMRIGGHPTATGNYSYLSEARPEHLQPKVNYIYECKHCGHQMKTARKLKRNYSCGKCSPRSFNPDFILELKQNYREKRLQGFSLS